ncbi:MAG: lamin tail domain-containing protein [Deltaproteobacteria bacterium]|nr:MAG: lamin tail domain-containing protein [Deltaproteobacteria bacterium]
MRRQRKTRFLSILLPLAALLFLGQGQCTPCTDTDGDGLCDEEDNCPGIANPEQEDCDMDGTGDACEDPGTVVINEIMYNPFNSQDGTGEYIELHNTGGIPVNISGWFIQDVLDQNQTLIGGPDQEVPIDCRGYFVLAQNGNPETNGGIENVGAIFSFALNNNIGDSVILRDPNLNIIDRVDYRVGQAPWPLCAHPDGSSEGIAIELSDPALDNSNGINWHCASTPYGDGDLGTPGEENSSPES